MRFLRSSARSRASADRRAARQCRRRLDRPSRVVAGTKAPGAIEGDEGLAIEIEDCERGLDWVQIGVLDWGLLSGVGNGKGSERCDQQEAREVGSSPQVKHMRKGYTGVVW
jgi:hypothetical protein